MASFEFRDYDTLDIVKVKYSLSKKGALPEYFIFPTDDVLKLRQIIQQDPKKILDIRSVLRGVSASDLEGIYKTQTKRKWHLKQKKTGVALLWMVVNNATSAKGVKFLEVGYFDPESRIREYKEYVEAERERLSGLVRDYESSASVLAESPKKQERDYRIEREARLSTVSTGESLFQLFDRIQCSKDVPFVSLQTGGRNLYKSYARIPPAQSWLSGRGGLEDFGTGDVILMKVLSFSSSEFSENNPSQLARLDKFYDEVIWTPSEEGKQNVLVDVTIREGMTYSDVQKRVTDAFRGEPVVFENTRTSTVKASYYIYDLPYKRAEFVDVLLRNPLTSKFFFSNETVSTTLSKSRFYVYFDPMQKRDPSDISVAFLPASSKSTDTKIRIARAKSEGEIQAFNDLFLSILGFYEKELPSVTALYDRFIPAAQRFKEKVKKGADDEELRNIVNLRRTYPDLFSKKYSKQCTAAVSILSEKEAKELRRSGQKNRVLEYPKGSGMFFGCKSKKHKDHKYPALRFNVRPFSEKYEFVPCCYTEPSEKPRRHPEGCVERVFGADKKELPENTCGFIPSSLERFFQVVMDAEAPVTILRHSVDVAPDSMLYCVEMARNKDFYELDQESDRAQHIKARRQEISKMESFSVGRQELYDFRSTEEIRELIKKTTFFDSLLFVRILEKFYNINIVVFSLGKDRSVSFEIPRHAKSWIPPYFDPRKKTVVLLRVPWRDMPYPSQYEILFTVPKEQTDGIGKKKKPGEPKSKISIKHKDFTFRDPEFIGKLFGSLYATNRVWSVSIDKEGLEKSSVKPKNPKEHPLLRLAKSQHIDSFGKTRTLFFEGGISLVISPICPLDVPEQERFSSSSRLSKAREFSEKLEMPIVSQELDREKRTTGVHLETEGTGLDLCFVPIVSSPSLEGVPKATTITIPRGESSLQIFRTKRAAASRLVEYGIILSARLGRFLKREDFVVDGNFDAEVARRDPSSLITAEQKLRVPTKNSVTKLLFAVSSAIKNLPFAKIQTEQYKTVSDFKILPNTVVFLTEKALNVWVKNYEAQDTTISVRSTPDAETTLPYFFDNQKLLVVQNVREGRKETAGFIVDRWRKKRSNPGFETTGTFEGAPNCDEETVGNCVSESGSKWSARLE